MATLLQGVNKVLRRVNILTGDTNELSTLTDSARQVFIDTAVQVWNEAVIELYSVSNMAMPNELAEATITLAAGDRDYALNAAMVQLHWPLIDATNNRYIEEYPGGYVQMKADQATQTNTGIPYFAVIRPSDGELYIDTEPTASEAGLTYTYYYDKDLELSSGSDTFPFKGVVFNAMVPAVAEMWRRNRNKTYDPTAIKKSMGVASRYLRQKQQRSSWFEFNGPINTTDPYA